jgi:hypothetical protein
MTRTSVPHLTRSRKEAQVVGNAGHAAPGGVPSAAALTQGNDTRADDPQGDQDWQHQPNTAQRANAATYKIAGSHTLFAGDHQGVAAQTQ